jgi:sugar O-acyltransferase (sialic acid O-acetyltransferase NeuD family)
MKDIVIFGAGGLGREVACLIKRINAVQLEWNLVGFYDDGIEVGTKNEYGAVLGNVHDLANCDNEMSVAIAIGAPKTVKKIVDILSVNEKLQFPNLISPDFNISDPDNYSMGYGNIIQRNCTISCNVNMGSFNILNTGIGLGHDARMGDYNSFMPAVKISGEVTIGDCNFFGVGSIVLQQLKVGNGIKLGAGSVLMRRAKDDTLYMGNPAKKVIIE